MADDTWCSPWLKPLTHTHTWPTHQPQCNTLWCMPWCPSTMPLTHTPKEEDHGLMAKVASTTCHHYERERDWMVDSGLVSMDKPLATQQGKRRHHSSHAAITQASTNNHHTITLTTQAWSWSLTACSLTLTHTRAKAGQGAHHHQANGVDGLHSDHGVAQAWLWCGVAIKPCATRGGTHAIQVATCSPHCPTTTTTPVLSGVNTRATTSPHPSPRVCV